VPAPLRRDSDNGVQHHLFTSKALEGLVDGNLPGGDLLAAFVEDILRPAVESVRSTLTTTVTDLRQAWTDEPTPAELFRIIGVAGPGVCRGMLRSAVVCRAGMRSCGER
jgi:hypothetical protein